VVSTNQDLNSVSGKKLYMTTTSIRGIGEANFSSPKWIVLKSELYQDGALLGNFEFRRTTMGGKLSTYKTLDFMSEALKTDGSVCSKSHQTSIH
jgi:hypothetical protein